MTPATIAALSAVAVALISGGAVERFVIADPTIKAREILEQYHKDLHFDEDATSDTVIEFEGGWQRTRVYADVCLLQKTNRNGVVTTDIDVAPPAPGLTWTIQATAPQNCRSDGWHEDSKIRWESIERLGSRDGWVRHRVAFDVARDQTYRGCIREVLLRGPNGRDGIQWGPWEKCLQRH